MNLTERTAMVIHAKTFHFVALEIIINQEMNTQTSTRIHSNPYQHINGVSHYHYDDIYHMYTYAGPFRKSCRKTTTNERHVNANNTATICN